MMIKILLLSLLNINLISLSRGCCIFTDRPISEELKKNLRAPWLVLLVDKTLDRRIRGVGYGTLIAEDRIFTSAKFVTDFIYFNLRVEADCNKLTRRSDFGKMCISKGVNNVTFTKGDFDDIDADKDPIVLSLSEPFELNERVNTIKLLSDKYIDNYDPNNCFTYHWSIEFNGNDLDGAFIIQEYRASLADDGTFEINKDDEVNKIPYDFDCVSSHCSYLEDPPTIKPSYLNFLGSPVVCPLKSDPDQLIQVGFATNVYRLYPGRTIIDKKEYEYLKGNLVDFSLLQNEFHNATDHAYDN